MTIKSAVSTAQCGTDKTRPCCKPPLQVQKYRPKLQGEKGKQPLKHVIKFSLRNRLGSTNVDPADHIKSLRKSNHDKPNSTVYKTPMELFLERI